MSRRSGPRVRWDLIGCARAGHALVGGDVATIEPGDDDVLVRVLDGERWHRCLRCDAWVWLPVPAAPTREHLPARDEIELPMRGKPLRDRYVLRLIALERLLHVVVFATGAVLILAFAGNRDLLQADFREVVAALEGGDRTPGSGILAEIAKLFHFTDRSLYVVAAVALGYAALEAVEAVGLWFAKRWAEYLTFLATIAFLPLELHELSERVTFLRLLTLGVNLAVAVYLLWAKRLFGLRGGGRAESARTSARRGLGRRGAHDTALTADRLRCGRRPGAPRGVRAARCCAR